MSQYISSEWGWLVKNKSGRRSHLLIRGSFLHNFIHVVRHMCKNSCLVDIHQGLCDKKIFLKAVFVFLSMLMRSSDQNMFPLPRQPAYLLKKMCNLPIQTCNEYLRLLSFSSIIWIRGSCVERNVFFFLPSNHITI